MTAVCRAARMIVAAYDADGVAVWQNNGIPAHQSVPHVHFHVLPRFQTETPIGDPSRA